MTPGSCGSRPTDWTSAPSVGNSTNYTRPTTTYTEHAHSDDAEYFRSRDYSEVEYDARDLDYGDDELDASAYGVTSSTRPEVQPLVVDIYAVSDTQRRHDASHVVYSWSRDNGARPVTSLSGYDDDYEYYDDLSDVIDDSEARRGSHMTSYVGQPGSRGHEKLLGQYGWKELEKTTVSSAGLRLISVSRQCEVAIAIAAAATIAMATVRRL